MLGLINSVEITTSPVLLLKYTGYGVSDVSLQLQYVSRIPWDKAKNLVSSLESMEM